MSRYISPIAKGVLARDPLAGVGALVVRREIVAGREAPPRAGEDNRLALRIVDSGVEGPIHLGEQSEALGVQFLGAIEDHARHGPGLVDDRFQLHGHVSSSSFWAIGRLVSGWRAP
jgi:hypothetical protein